MSSIKHTVQLTQHTPLLHFQHEQQGATLRATELKPKLDQFIARKNGGWEKIHDDWLVGRGKGQADHKALDYKVRIHPTETKTYSIDKRGFPLFFGNMGDGKHEKKLVWSSHSIHLELVCLVPNLLKQLEEHLNNFFAHTNFGTRQSKGFGSFYPQDATAPTLQYYFDVPVRGNGLDAWRQLLSEIDLFYRTLRSGINVVNRNKENLFYFKSMLFLYGLQQKSWQWDKRSIKEHFLNGALTEERSHHPPDPDTPLFAPIQSDKPLLRDVMGLSSDQSWYTHRDTLKKESVAKGRNRQPLYARFKSPIFFKPIQTGNANYRVYFEVPSHIREAFCTGNPKLAAEANILGKEFEISFKNNRRSNLKLSFPQTFDFGDYFHFAFSQDLEQHIDRDFHRTREFATLARIYDQLEQQV